MLVTIEVPEYNPHRGIESVIDTEAVIESEQMGDGEIVIRANAVGLTMLATHLLMVTQESMRFGADMCYDELGELSEGSVRFRFVKIP